MTTVVLARHGETDWNRDGRFQGHADPPLNANGRAQARELAARLSGDGITAVWSSDLQRARETATIVAEQLGLTVAARADLREADVGELTGLTRAEIHERFPAAVPRAERHGYTWASGEGYEAVAARVLTALHEIASSHTGETVLVVTHGGPLRIALAHADGVELAEHRRLHGPMANCAVVPCVFEGGVFRRLD